LKRFDVGLVDRIATPVIIIGLVFSVYFVNLTSMQVNRTLIQALQPQPALADNIRFFREALAYDAPIGKQEVREQLIQLATRANRPQVPIETRQELYTLAATEMQQFIENNPNDARLHLFLGSLHETYGQAELANQEFQRALELTPNKQAVRFTLAGNLLNLGRKEDALALLEETKELEPRNSEAHIMHAVAAIYNGDNALADQILVDFFGTDVVDSPRLIQAYANQGDMDKVVAIWELRVENQPNNAQFRLALAAAYLEIEEREQAIEQIERARELDPSLQQQADYLIGEIRAGRNP
jgi:tetratricopeptide (TPR) repeat protein